MLSIFQCDNDVISHHLNQRYSFDIFGNKYKYYLPKLMIHVEIVDIYQSLHTPYMYEGKE